MSLGLPVLPPRTRLADAAPSRRFVQHPRRGRRGSTLEVVLLCVTTAIAAASEPIAISGRAMGTTWTVKFEQPAAPLDSQQVERQVARRLEELEQQFSTYRAQSTLSQFNAARHTGWITVEPELAQVAAASRELSALTGGAFDVTVHPLVRLWGFGGMRNADGVTSAAELGVARELVDWRALEVRTNPPALRKAKPGIAADFSSMAKGFAADALSELLVQWGAARHFVQIGGDVKSGGTRANGGGWRTGIEHPVETTHAIACIVELRGQALSTSGDYRNFVQVGARRFGHIIDPRTGQPVSGALASVSVVHRSAATSSALATALFVLGADDGYRLAREQQLACLFQVRNGPEIVQRATPEFARLIEHRAQTFP